MSTARDRARADIRSSTLAAFGLALASTATLQAQEGVAAASPSRTAAVSLRIAAQPMPDALAEFAQQTGLQIVVSSDSASQLRTAGVSGTFTPEAALDALLANSGLHYRFINERTVAVTREGMHDGGRRTTPGEVETSQTGPAGSATTPAMLRLAQAEGAAAGVAGQERPASVDAIEEVRVTAQKIEQRLIDVPVSITALGEEELEALRVVGSDDYLLAVPNLTYIKDNRQWGARVAIRGISGQSGGEFAPNNVMVDGIAYNMSNTGVLLGMRSFDIEAVEVYRGPQGTLGGANSLGGTINLVTAKPSTQALDGKVIVDYGRFNTRYLSGVINTPVSDTFAIRAAAHKEDSDGVTRNYGPGGGSSGSDNAGVRLAARWLPAENLTVDLSGSYERQSFGFDDVAYVDDWYDGAAETSAARADKLALYEALGRSFVSPQTPFFGDGAGNNGSRLFEDVSSFDRNDSSLAALQINYAAGAHIIDLQYGYFHHAFRNHYDIDNSDVGFGMTTLYGGVDSHGVEMRVTSNYGGPIKWLAGLAWQKEEADFSDVSYLSELGYAWNVLGEPAAALPGLGEAFDHHFYTYYRRSTIDSRAAFANVFWDFAERWHLTAGVRYTRFDARFGTQCCGESGTLDGRSRDDLLAELAPVEYPEGALHEVNPRIALNYDLSEDAAAYVQFATGFRPGYANDSRAVDAGLADASADPEYVKNYEIGIKASLFDRRAGVAAALFYLDYTDLQVYRDADIQNAHVSYTINAGGGEVKGLEFESFFKPTERLELRASAGYSDAEIGELDLGYAYLDGVRMPGVRPWNTVFTGIYQRPLPNGLDASLRLDHRWQDLTWNFALLPEEFSPIARLPSWQTVDLSAGLEGRSWELTAYVENVLDEQFYTSKMPWTGRPLAYFIPRMYGLRFAYRFGH
jgi:iron complex outermembrane receptor protein